jgi:hypothetical protein
VPLRQQVPLQPQAQVAAPQRAERRVAAAALQPVQAKVAAALEAALRERAAAGVAAVPAR